MGKKEKLGTNGDKKQGLGFQGGSSKKNKKAQKLEK